MTTTPTHLRNITKGYAEVLRGYDIIGTVKRIDRPHMVNGLAKIEHLSLIHISEPTRLSLVSRMPSSA